MIEAAETYSAPLFLTIVPVEARVPESDLESFDALRFLSTLSRRLRREKALGGASLMLALDVTFEEPASAWQFHLHGVAFGIEKAELLNGLRRHFPSTSDIRRPAMVLPVKDRPRQLSYVTKGFWIRRTSYFSKTGRRSSKAYPLKGQQLKHLLTYLDRYRPSDLLVLINMHRGPAGRLRIGSRRVTGRQDQTRRIQ